MRRSKQTAAGQPPVGQPPVGQAAGGQPAVAAPRPPTHLAQASSAELTGDDLERGRTTALIATLGRVQLTLDLIERRLGRLEDAVLEVRDVLAAEREAGLVPAELAYVDSSEDDPDEDDPDEDDPDEDDTDEAAGTLD